MLRGHRPHVVAVENATLGDDAGHEVGGRVVEDGRYDPHRRVAVVEVGRVGRLGVNAFVRPDLGGRGDDPQRHVLAGRRERNPPSTDLADDASVREHRVRANESGVGVGVDPGGDGIPPTGPAVATEQNGRSVSENAGDNTVDGDSSAAIDTTLALGVGGTTI